MRKRISKTVVDSTDPPASGEVTVWDTELPGFLLRVRSTGSKSYAVQYGAGRAGRSRKIALGHHGQPAPPDPATGQPRTWTAEVARLEARRVLGLVAAGLDPAEERAAGRGAITLRELAVRYLEEWAGPRKKAASLRSDRGLLGLLPTKKRKDGEPRKATRKARTILGAMGHLRVDRLTTADVARLHASWRDTPTRANRALALLSHLLAVAERWRLRSGPNPCRHVERYREAKRKRYLSPAELARLGTAIAASEENPHALAAIRLLILTGAREGEILSARWDHVDLDAGLLVLDDSKTGAKVVHLPSAAVRLLRDLDHVKGNPHVIPGRVRGRPFGGSSLGHVWERVRKEAGLKDVRLHDLRHTFASVVAGGGGSLPIIGALLGHTQPATTARYAHLAASPLREAAEAAGQVLTAGLSGEKKG